MELDKVVYFEDDFGFDDSNCPMETQFKKESVFIPNVIVLDREVFYLMVDEPVVVQNDLVVDE